MRVLRGLASAAAEGSASLSWNGRSSTRRGRLLAQWDRAGALRLAGAAPGRAEDDRDRVEGDLISELASGRPWSGCVRRSPRSSRTSGTCGPRACCWRGHRRERARLRARRFPRPPDRRRRYPVGGLAFADRVRVGQTVPLHVRDWVRPPTTCARRCAARRGLGPSAAAGALLFTCNGRGAHMFAEPDHDALALDQAFGAPAGGFFCAARSDRRQPQLPPRLHRHDGPVPRDWLCLIGTRLS